MALIRIALWVIVIMIALRIIGRMLRARLHIEIITPQNPGGMRRQPGPHAGRAGEGAAEMVQDPVCGAWIAADHAVKANAGAVTHFFCSQRCLDEYRKKLNA